MKCHCPELETEKKKLLAVREVRDEMKNLLDHGAVIKADFGGAYKMLNAALGLSDEEE